MSDRVLPMFPINRVFTLCTLLSVGWMAFGVAAFNYVFSMCIFALASRYINM